MFRNYLTIALRNIIRHRLYSFINIAGLSVGMAVAMLIGFWMYDELTYNHYHADHNGHFSRLPCRSRIPPATPRRALAVTSAHEMLAGFGSRPVPGMM